MCLSRDVGLIVAGLYVHEQIILLLELELVLLEEPPAPFDQRGTERPKVQTLWSGKASDR